MCIKCCLVASKVPVLVFLLFKVHVGFSAAIHHVLFVIATAGCNRLVPDAESADMIYGL